MKKDVVIVGSGCAGFAAADRLLNFGITDIVLLTEGKNCGTSRNTGSDKQTYYKADLTLSGDSIIKMAESIYEGGGVDGEKAVIEAVNSLRCFYTLEEYGLDFPKGDYGEYIGYKTDHDDSVRATSLGPLTSKKMTEALEKSASGKGLQIIDNSLAVKICTKENNVFGIIYLDLQTNVLNYIETACVILAVGGSAAVYKDVVYPPSQHGSLSLALDCGCRLQNITEWQYGIASTDFRWNLSGSYQQIVPRYVSVDKNGNEYEFLDNYISGDVFDLTFLKGCEWPFDSKKVNASSQIDLAVLEEIKKGRQVFLDYRKNPKGFKLNENSAAFEFWKKNEIIGNTPYERLCALNKKAADLYKAHNIDLSREKLRIAVCAQHCNGGAKVDINFETDIKGLFAIGEASGNFGVYRPGGTALNSTQVGALRAAQKISRDIKKYRINNNFCDFDDLIKSEQEFLDNHIEVEENIISVSEYFKSQFSKYAGIIRDVNEIKRLKSELKEYLDGSKTVAVPSKLYAKLLYSCYDMIKTQYALAVSILDSYESLGSRGGSVTKKGSFNIDEKPDSKEFIVESDYNKASLIKRKPIIIKEYLFEKYIQQEKK